ncbi:MAG: sugar phosphate isomerase/epimerase [Bacteroidetes bacterium]|uniref:Sugar phosphate isomerase/epimerase n=1 Tax=Candidatus Cryptobacteroides faecipullorum TaxID=2840764 RepID=A0A9D9I5M8_9BACT|nr:sugar phosphate isomerase/epimerase [Candidatus Cryptobacteroides faecipullorum]
MKTKTIISILAAALLAVSCGQSGNAGEAGANGQKKEIAVQLYSVRSLIGAFGNNSSDYKPLLDTLAKMGYTAVEAASYSDDGKLYGQDPAQFKADVEAAGMKVLSSHCNKYLTEQEIRTGDFSEALKWWDTCIAAHKAAGMKYLVMPYLGVPSTVKELQAYCDYFNQVGKKCQENGIKFGYHNHAHEFQKVENKEVMYDYMLQHTDPELVFFEMDVYWTVMGHASPVDYFKKYPGRFKVLHIKDEREIGQSGMVGFDAIFKNAGTAGVENIVVEVERYSYDDVARSIKESIDYLEAAPFVPAVY